MRAVNAPESREAPASILVIRLGAIGDVIRTLPAVSCLRRAFPEARISWAVEEPSRTLLEGDPVIDEVLVLRRKILSAALRLRDPAGALGHLRSYVGSLRERRFDWAVDLHGTLKSALLARASRARRILGFGPGHTRELAHLLYSDPVPLPQRKMSRVERALAVAEALGADRSSPRRILPVREGAARAVRPFLEEEARKRPRVFIYPGTSPAQAYKRYPADLLARAADRIAGDSGGSVILGWGPGEEGIANDLLRSMSRPALLAPPTRLDELAELVRGCDLFVGSDTGPLHLAAAVGIPLVALYGPTDAAVNAPYTDGPAASLTGDVACRPCRNRGCLNRSCLRTIDPAEVARRALDLLGAGPPPGPAPLSGRA